MDTQIQIQFPCPGEWGRINMTAVFPDADGFVQSRSYTQDDIPVDQAPALAAVVAALVGLAEPWQARQVWARLGDVPSNTPAEGEDGPPETSEAVVLTVEAVNGSGGRRVFTDRDYPEFTIADPSAVEFFKNFTQSGSDGRQNGN